MLGFVGTTGFMRIKCPVTSTVEPKKNWYIRFKNIKHHQGYVCFKAQEIVFFVYVFFSGRKTVKVMIALYSQKI